MFYGCFVLVVVAAADGAQRELEVHVLNYSGGLICERLEHLTPLPLILLHPPLLLHPKLEARGRRHDRGVIACLR